MERVGLRLVYVWREVVLSFWFLPNTHNKHLQLVIFMNLWEGKTSRGPIYKSQSTLKCRGMHLPQYGTWYVGYIHSSVSPMKEKGTPILHLSTSAERP